MSGTASSCIVSIFNSRRLLAPGKSSKSVLFKKGFVSAVSAGIVKVSSALNALNLLRFKFKIVFSLVTTEIVF